MDTKDLPKLYEQRYHDFLIKVVPILEEHLKERILKYERIDKISVRAKSKTRFVEKAQQKSDNELLKYDDPMNQIQDQIGARIVTYYLDDISNVCKIVEDYYRHIEKHQYIPDKINEFGYEGIHYVLFLPEDIYLSNNFKDNVPKFFELQIKTLFQHAWSEAEHDLGYKPNYELSKYEKRKIAFTAAQAWGADYIFNELNQKSTLIR